MNMVACEKPDSDRRGIMLCYMDDLVLTSHRDDNVFCIKTLSNKQHFGNLIAFSFPNYPLCDAFLKWKVLSTCNWMADLKSA